VTSFWHKSATADGLFSTVGEEHPLRAELLSVDQLARHAASLAKSHQLAEGRGSDRLLPRLDENERILAELANIVNESALLAARRGRERITLGDLQEAVERVVGGFEKRNRVLTPEERRRVAFHEVGHALVAISVPRVDPVQKISIIPRGIAALGYTLQVPTVDRFVMTQAELEGKLAVLLGGRTAEQLVFGDLSTSAQDDLLKATEIARAMVRSYGMSSKLGAISFEGSKRSTLLGPMSELGTRDYGDQVARVIDDEIQRVLEEQGQRSKALLERKRQILAEAAERLLVQETLSAEELRSLASGRSVAAA
jgi:cell division protease FtsH